MSKTGHIAIILLLLFSNGYNAIAQNKNRLIIADDHLVLRIDLHSSKNELDSVLKVAGLGNFNIDRILKGDFSALSDDGWNIGERDGSFIKFERPLVDLRNNPQSKPYLITTRMRQTDGKPGYPDKVKYGVNKFAKIIVYELPSGLTRFMLPGYSEAKRVFLSGSFNNWSTLKGVMKKMDGGWMIDIKLNAGAYEYKYIIGGRWRTDPNNLLQMDDGAGNRNSVYYKYNYTFKLPGYSLARRVLVAGSFNNWNANEFIMQKNGNTWQQPMYLGEGTYTYRFMVDGAWMPDPENPTKETDEKGNVNSVLNLGETVTFELAGYAEAKKVFVAGDFNNWKKDQYSLQRKGDAWILPLVLTTGNHYYKFIVDGKWVTDPQNPHRSVEKGEPNSFLAVRPNYTFKLKGYEAAKTVTLTGVFNNWEPNGYTMKHIGDEWIIDFYLKPGKYLYKFRVDGKWILDPGNKLWEQNEFNTGNSVLWIE